MLTDLSFPSNLFATINCGSDLRQPAREIDANRCLPSLEKELPNSMRVLLLFNYQIYVFYNFFFTGNNFFYKIVIIDLSNSLPVKIIFFFIAVLRDTVIIISK